MNLFGSRFLITGASGGIGREIVKAFACSNVTLCISGSKRAPLEEVKNLCPDANINILPCDLSNGEQVSKLVASAVDVMGGIDGVIFNAGITEDKLALRMRDEDWQKVIDINLTACFKVLRDSCKVMMKTGGRIICVSSVIAVTGNAGQVNYSASKGGMISMSKSFALEFAKKGITVNCILPGFIDTQMTAVLPEAHKEAVIAKIPMNRMGRPEEVASLIRFLASKDAGYITGSTFNISGGLLTY